MNHFILLINQPTITNKLQREKYMEINSFKNYIQFEKRYSEHTVRAYISDLTQFLNFSKDKFDVSDVKQINHSLIRTWMVELISQNTSTRSINRKISTLKTYFTFLLKKNEITVNPMLKIISPKSSKKLPVFVPEKEIKKLLASLKASTEFKDIRDGLVLTLLYATGMRKAELIGLLIENINYEKRTIKILGKGNKERILPFSPEIGKLIRNYIDASTSAYPNIYSPYLFHNEKGNKLYPKAVYNIVNAYLDSIPNLEKKSPHVLRHSFATHLLDNEAELKSVSSLLGHSSLVATQVYTHSTVERLKKVYQSAHPKSRKKLVSIKEEKAE